MKIRPLNDRIVVKLIEDAVPAFSLIVIEDKKLRPSKGIVVGVGPGKREKRGRRPMSVKEGDTVLVSRGAGQLVSIEKQELIVLFEEDIIAIVKA